MEVKFNLSNSEHKELVSYCNLNNLLINDIITKSFKTGFNIERYGLLNSIDPVEKIITKEVVVEKIIEKPIEVIKIEYVEKPVEVIKEVFVEKEIKEDDKKIELLQNTIQKLKKENIDKDKQIQEFEKKLGELQNSQQEKKAIFLRGSNLDDKLYG